VSGGRSGSELVLGRRGLALVLTFASAFAPVASADSLELPVDIQAGQLADGLKMLQRQTGIDLLYAGNVVSGIESSAVSGNLTTEVALRELLEGTRLASRRASSGAWIIEREATPLPAQPDAAIAEILVVGRRTQNADIRRFENDVQPHVVVTREELSAAHRDDIDQYFANRITANTQVRPAYTSQDGETYSEINLRGLGSEQTLVLVDGRRLPGFPVPYNEFRQSDLNAIPPNAIERIEILTGTAGGIHGFGALGGVVNVILDRDPGLDLHVSQGISSRGDAHRHGFEARFGKSFREERTSFMLFGSRMESDTVLANERGYGVRDRRRTFETDPDFYLFQYRYGDSIRVRSPYRINFETFEVELEPKLVFKPGYGGATLSSHETFLPTGFSGDANALVAELTRNAGNQDFSLPAEDALVDLGSNPHTEALLASVRHGFGPGLEVYADAMLLSSRGVSRGDASSLGVAGSSALIEPTSPVSPFTEFLVVDFPIEGMDFERSKRVETRRYTAGFSAQLPHEWRGTAEFSAGELRYSTKSSSEIPTSLGLILIGDPSDLDTNPFGDWAAFQRAVGSDVYRFEVSLENRTRSRNYSLRLAGPAFSSAAGAATLTLLAERRREEAPAYTEYHEDSSQGPTEARVAARSKDTDSFYAELRAPWFDETAPAVLRGLETQLAVRRDEQRDRFAHEPLSPDTDFVHARFTGTSYTAGAKISPTPWLMLRASYATGEQPPLLFFLNELDPVMTSLPYASDPQRGGTPLGAEGEFLYRGGGLAAIDAALASTTVLGIVLSPLGLDGPKVGLDFSRIRRTRDVLQLSSQEILDNEQAWPERVERAPLTDSDRASGFSAGRVTMLDSRVSNGARLEVDAIDLRVDWPLRFLGGRLRLYADATYHKRNTFEEPFQPDVNRAGYRDGPLKRRANGGFDWSRKHLTFGANLQYFGSYLVLTQGPLADLTNESYERIQGSRQIPSQSYLDLHASWRVPFQDFGVLEELTVDLGVLNALDDSPPRENAYVFSGPGYSRYGDPRQRRFELGLSVRF
jgi:outer membrane receptor protein involved in Fe transport